jgi:hypothetical protein
MEHAPESRPIRSRWADDPALRERIDRFVVGLGERVDTLQDLELAGELKQLGALAAECAHEAGVLGFEPLREGALALERVCQRGDRAAVRAELEAVTDLARRVRVGHSGTFY